MAVLFGILLAFAAMILWGFSDVIAKASLDKVSKWKILFISQFIGGLLIFVLAALFEDLGILLSNAFFFLIFLGLLNLAGMYSFYKAMKVRGVALTSPIAYSYVLVTVILGLIFYKETVNMAQWLAVILIVAGIFMMTPRKNENINFDSSFMFAVLSMIIFGVFFFFLKVPNLVFGAIIVTSSIKLLTSLFTIPILLHKRIKLFQMNHKALFYIIIIGIFDSAGFLAFNFGLKYSPVSIVSAISSAAPMLSVLLGVIILKEELSKMQTIGAISAIIGLVLISLI